MKEKLHHLKAKMTNADNVKLAIWAVIYQKELLEAFMALLARVESDIEGLPDREVEEGKQAREVLAKIREAANA